VSRLEKFVLHDGNSDARTWRQKLGDAFVAARRSIWLGPVGSKDKRLAELFGGQPTSTGLSVNVQQALSVAAVWSAVSAISSDTASLPLKLYRRLPGGGREPFEGHPMYRLLHDAWNPETTSYVARQMLMTHVLLHGNAFVEIERDAAGRPKYLWPIASDRVMVERDDNGALRYRVSGDGNDVYLDPSRMLHFRGPSLDGILGLDVVRTLREALSLSIAADRFGGSFFGNGATVGSVVSTPHNLTEQQREGLRKAIEARHQGADRAHRLMVLEGGLSFTPLSVNMHESQFNELRTFQIREVARIFRIPPHKLADLSDATFSNVAEQNIEYVTGCLRPHLTMIEQELEAKLISPLERSQQSIVHVVEALLRGSHTERAGFYSTMLGHGALSINEVRALENLPPVEGGDTPRIPLNTGSLGENNAA
jgi:HK97 family phage portal protein